MTANEMKNKVPENLTLSHYRIVAKLGAGGMGEVYRARDKRLGRQIAKLSVGPIARADDSCSQRCPKPAIESAVIRGRVNR